MSMNLISLSAIAVFLWGRGEDRKVSLPSGDPHSHPYCRNSDSAGLPQNLGQEGNGYLSKFLQLAHKERTLSASHCGFGFYRGTGPKQSI